MSRNLYSTNNNDCCKDHHMFELYYCLIGLHFEDLLNIYKIYSIYYDFYVLIITLLQVFFFSIFLLSRNGSFTLIAEKYL